MGKKDNLKTGTSRKPGRAGKKREKQKDRKAWGKREGKGDGKLKYNVFTVPTFLAVFLYRMSFSSEKFSQTFW